MRWEVDLTTGNVAFYLSFNAVYTFLRIARPSIEKSFAALMGNLYIRPSPFSLECIPRVLRSQHRVEYGFTVNILPLTF